MYLKSTHCLQIIGPFDVEKLIISFNVEGDVDLLIKCLPVLSKLCTEVHLEDSLLPQCKKHYNSQRHNAGQINSTHLT